MSPFTRAPRLSLAALLAATAALVAMLLALAPAANSTPDARPRIAGLKDFGSCAKLRGYLVKHRRAYGTGGGVVGTPIAGFTTPSPAGDAPVAPTAPDESSPTNVQET